VAHPAIFQKKVSSLKVWWAKNAIYFFPNRKNTNKPQRYPVCPTIFQKLPLFASGYIERGANIREFRIKDTPWVFWGAISLKLFSLRILGYVTKLSCNIIKSLNFPWQTKGNLDSTYTHKIRYEIIYSVSVIWVMFLSAPVAFLDVKCNVHQHGRSQRRQRSHAPQICGSCCFVFREAVYHTEYCCSLEVKHIWPLPKFWTSYATVHQPCENICSVRF